MLQRQIDQQQNARGDGAGSRQAGVIVTLPTTHSCDVRSHIATRTLTIDANAMTNYHTNVRYAHKMTFDLGRGEVAVFPLDRSDGAERFEMGRALNNGEESLVELCDVSEVRPDAPKKVDKLGMAYAVFQVGESFHVTQDTCTHGPGSLSEGYVDGGEIECPFHQGRFCIATGKPTSAPCTVPLQVWKVVLRDGKICIAHGHSPAGAAGEAS